MISICHWKWGLILLVSASNAVASSDNLSLQGENLFYGRGALTGKLYLHNTPLGVEYVRCANCHQVQYNKDIKLSARYGPNLGQLFLSQGGIQKGSPEGVAYTPESFCTVLRSGIDPSGVMIKTDMPRYTITEAECKALWNFLQRH